jgi:dolichol-phosphate mannosyltransferase
MDLFSRDNTGAIIKRLEKEHPEIQFLFYKDSTGVVSCYLYGFQYALNHQADYIIEMDCGGSHAPEDLPQFIEKLHDGYDCVFGSRFMKGGQMVNVPLYRKLISRGGTVLANLLLGTSLTDMTSGFEGFQRSALERLDFMRFYSRGHFYQTEMKFRCRNFRVIEVPITYRSSTSSFRMKSLTEALRILLVLYRERR